MTSTIHFLLFVYCINDLNDLNVERI